MTMTIITQSAFMLAGILCLFTASKVPVAKGFQLLPLGLGLVFASQFIHVVFG